MSWVRAELFLLTLALCACKAQEGQPCAEASACSDGLTCFESLCTTQAAADERCRGRCNDARDGACSARQGRCAPASDGDCASSDRCVAEGRCSFVDGQCAIAKDGDCRALPACASEGRCRARDGACVIADDADCAGLEACTEEGRCVAREGRCVIARDGDCRRLAGCSRDGRCSVQADACAAASDGDCRGSSGCDRAGACHAAGGLCVARSDADCAASEGCSETGACTLHHGQCRARTAEDCKRWPGCKLRHQCTLDEPTGTCVAKVRDAAMRRKITEMLAEQLKLTAASMECPQDVTAEAGKSFECTVHIAPKGTVVVLVEMTSSEGHLAMKTKHPLVIVEKLAKEAEQKGITDLDCGEPFFAIEPGEVYTCSASVNGVARRVVIKPKTDKDYDWWLE